MAVDINKLSDEDLDKLVEIKKNAEGLISRQAGSEKDVTKLESFIRGTVQGLTFNFADEAQAIASANIADPLLKKFTGKGLYDNVPEDKKYDVALEQIRSSYKAASEANPLSSMGGEVVGAIAGPGTFVKAGKGLGVLAKAGVRVAESAALGGAAGAGAAEGDKLAGFKSGATTGALFSGAMEAARPLAKGFIKSAQGLSEDAYNYLKSNPDKIDKLKKLATNKNDAIADISTDVAGGLSAKLKELVSEQTALIDNEIANFGNKPVSTKSIVGAINNKIVELKKGGFTPDVQKAIGILEQQKRNFVGQSKNLTAERINALRKEFNSASSDIYSGKVGDSSVVAGAYGAVADALRISLDEVSPLIREANGVLSENIKLRQEIASKFGARSLTNLNLEIDPADVQKILTSVGRENKATSVGLIEKLAKSTNVPVLKEAELLNIVKSLDVDAGKGLSKSFTGRSLLSPMLGFMFSVGPAAAASGNLPLALLGGSAGALLGAGAQSPAGLQFLLKGTNAANRTTGGLSSILGTRSGENK